MLLNLLCMLSQTNISKNWTWRLQKVKKNFFEFTKTNVSHFLIHHRRCLIRVTFTYHNPFNTRKSLPPVDYTGGKFVLSLICFGLINNQNKDDGKLIVKDGVFGLCSKPFSNLSGAETSDFLALSNVVLFLN